MSTQLRLIDHWNMMTAGLTPRHKQALQYYFDGVKAKWATATYEERSKLLKYLRAMVKQVGGWIEGADNKTPHTPTTGPSTLGVEPVGSPSSLVGTMPDHSPVSYDQDAYMSSVPTPSSKVWLIVGSVVVVGIVAGMLFMSGRVK